MTHKDYVLIAAALKSSSEDGAFSIDEMVRNIAHRLAESLALDNPRFDRGRFLKAAGVQS
jgi:hypothetical protein